jgi:hypothetical protein
VFFFFSFVVSLCCSRRLVFNAVPCEQVKSKRAPRRVVQRTPKEVAAAAGRRAASNVG